MPKRKSDGTADFWGMARSYLHVYCKKVRGLSPKTVDTYREALECYLAFLSDEKGVERSSVSFDCFERELLREWLSWMTLAKGYAPKTVGTRLTGVRAFLRWCADEDVALGALYSGCRSLKPPKVPKKAIDYLRDDELAAVLAANKGESEKSRRNRMMLVLLYETAARVSELVDMALEDIKLSKPAHVVLRGKGGKARVVPLGNLCVEHLKVYLAEFHPGKPDPRAPLLFSMRCGEKTPLSTDTVSRVLKQAGDRARAVCTTVPGNIHCHQIRRTRAMCLYKSGVPLPLVMQLLGHESMSTTSSFYAFATAEMMSAAVAAASPDVVSVDTGWLTEERKEVLYSLR